MLGCAADEDEDLECELRQLECELKAESPISKADKFKALIDAQSSQGFWPETAHNLIAQLMPKPLPPTQNLQLQLTVAAMCLLEEMFAAREQEWQLIYQKAKQWLLSQ